MACAANSEARSTRISATVLGFSRRSRASIASGLVQAIRLASRDARTFLTHFVGGGLDDDRYVIQRYRSQADGDIVPVDADGARPKGRRRPRTIVASLKAVEKLRPARDEIIIATGIRLRNCGVQLWGWRAMGIFVERRQKG